MISESSTIAGDNDIVIFKCNIAQSELDCVSVSILPLPSVFPYAKKVEKNINTRSPTIVCFCVATGDIPTVAHCSGTDTGTAMSGTGREGYILVPSHRSNQRL